MTEDLNIPNVSRRGLIKTGVGLGALAVAGPALASCSVKGGSSTSSSGTLKIGFVSPRTGPASGFGEPDGYALDLARTALKDGLTIGGKKYNVTIIDKDSQSDPTHSAQVAQDLISNENVDLMLTTSAPETVNPVSDACEAAGVPCISTVVPWEAWFFGRQKDPANPVPFKYTYHFCFGVAEFARSYETLWPQVATNQTVGVMYPNDADGNAIRENLAPALQKGGYTIVDPGAYTDGSQDYTSQIQEFKNKNCEIFNTFPIPPDFAVFWKQAAAAGYKPKIAQIAKTGLFPSQVEELGPIGINLASAAYWTPTWPYKSSLNGMSSADLGSGYEKTAKKQWNQQLGASVALLDAGAAALQAVSDPTDKTALAAAIGSLSVNTPIGTIAWSTTGSAKTPFPNVVTTPIIGGQWVKGTHGYPLDFVLCENSGDPNVPVAAKLIPYA